MGLLDLALTPVAAGTARYYLAQLMEDPLRREIRNVGLVVEKGGEVFARFAGECDGSFDEGALKAFRYPRAHRLWVDHWRKQIANYPKTWDQLIVSPAGTHGHSLIHGGEVAVGSGWSVCCWSGARPEAPP